MRFITALAFTLLVACSSSPTSLSETTRSQHEAVATTIRGPFGQHGNYQFVFSFSGTGTVAVVDPNGNQPPATGPAATVCGSQGWSEAPGFWGDHGSAHLYVSPYDHRWYVDYSAPNSTGWLATIGCTPCSALLEGCGEVAEQQVYEIVPPGTQWTGDPPQGEAARTWCPLHALSSALYRDEFTQVTTFGGNRWSVSSFADQYDSDWTAGTSCMAWPVSSHYLFLSGPYLANNASQSVQMQGNGFCLVQGYFGVGHLYPPIGQGFATSLNGSVGTVFGDYDGDPAPSVTWQCASYAH